MPVNLILSSSQQNLNLPLKSNSSSFSYLTDSCRISLTRTVCIDRFFPSPLLPVVHSFPIGLEHSLYHPFYTFSLPESRLLLFTRYNENREIGPPAASIKSLTLGLEHSFTPHSTHSSPHYLKAAAFGS
jgi:hypothetical protein